MDNAATSYPKPECVYRAVDEFNRKLGGNPGRGGNKLSIGAGSVVMEARLALAKMFGIADETRIAFTLNVTEAINTALKGFLKPGDHVITTSMEHNAVARPLWSLSRKGIEWAQVQCSPEGMLDPSEVRKNIHSNTRLICMLHVSNLTGTILPVAEIGRLARESGVTFMVDSAQSAGVLPIDVERQFIDILAFTGHKGLLGPQGTGGLYLAPHLEIEPLKEGGTGSLSEFLEQPDFMPDRLESGTLNTPGIAGLLSGVEYINGLGLEYVQRREHSLTARLISGLREIPGVKVYGPAIDSGRTAVVAFNIWDKDCNEVASVLDRRYGIVLRSGLHCAPLAHHTIGTSATGACRLSPGLFTAEEEIDYVVRSIYAVTRALK
jgi:cysteine desulfurase family protein